MTTTDLICTFNACQQGSYIFPMYTNQGDILYGGYCDTGAKYEIKGKSKDISEEGATQGVQYAQYMPLEQSHQYNSCNIAMQADMVCR
jgi:nitroimidazol reductase NimA-like FMN-containing flavoprotein (pyridoxamine 5'-phosphate oxidase superfamily)